MHQNIAQHRHNVLTTFFTLERQLYLCIGHRKGEGRRIETQSKSGDFLVVVTLGNVGHLKCHTTMKDVALCVLILLSFVLGQGLTASQKAKQVRIRREQATLPPNTTTVSTKHDDIAHFTCTTGAQATISWKKKRKDLSNSDLGIAILSTTNNGSLDSHLFIAVTDDDIRGKYECFSSDDLDVAMEAFVIENDPAREGMLSKEETWAIILSLAIAFILVTCIGFFLWRGNRRLKRARAEKAAARSRARNNHDGAEENLAVEEELVEVGANSVQEKKMGNENEKEPGTEDKKKPEGNGNNNEMEMKDATQSQSVGPEVIVANVPDK